MKNVLENWRDFCYYQHDVECNQKYGDGLPYSFHVGCVVSQVKKFEHLLGSIRIVNDKNSFSQAVSIKTIVTAAAFGHDLIEDARMTINDIVEQWEKADYGNSNATRLMSEIIYCVTDEKGKTRAERKNDKYYSELKANKYAIFVKLCDIAANTLYSKLTGSSMYNKYKKEFPALKEKLYLKEYDELFTYVEQL